MRSIRIIMGVVLALSLAPASSQGVTWTNLGENLNPGSLLSTTKRTDAFAHKLSVYGVDNNLAVKMNEASINGDGTTWAGWTDLGCCITGSVSAIAWPNYRDVYGIGLDGQLWHNQSINNGPFSGWFSLAHPQNLTWCGSPAAITNGTNKVSVFVRSCANGRGWYVSWTGSAWVWRDMGRNLTSDMAAVAINSDALEVWATEAGGRLLNDHYRNGGFTWRFTGASNVSFPAASADLQVNPAATGFAVDNHTGAIVAVRAPEGRSFSVVPSSSSGGIPRPVWFNDVQNGTMFFVYHLDRVRRIHRLKFTTTWSTTMNDLWNSGEEFAGHPSPIVGPTRQGPSTVHVFAVKASGQVWHGTDNFL